MEKKIESTNGENTDKKLILSNFISSLLDNMPSSDDEFIEILKTVDDKKFTLAEMFMAYRAESIRDLPDIEKYGFLAYIKQNYL